MPQKSLTRDRESLFLFGVVFLVYALVYMTKNCFSAAMASIVSEGVMTKSQTGLISAVFYLVYAVFQIFGGMAADKFSPARLILIGVLGAGVINLLVYFVNGYGAFLLLWGINAVVQFGIWPSIYKIISSQLAKPFRAKSIFYISLSSIFGLFISYLSAAMITSWKTNFLFSALSLFFAAALFYFGYRAVAPAMVEEKAETPSAPSEKKDGRGRAMLLSGLPFLLFSYGLLGILQQGMKSLVPVMLMESYASISASRANALNTVLILAAPLGVFLGRLPAFRRRTPVFIITAAFFTALFFLFPVLGVGSVPAGLLLLALALYMVLTQMISVFFLQIPAAFAPFGCVATISGILNGMAALGIVVSGYGFARLAETFGWRTTALCWFLATLAAGVLSFLALPLWKRFIRGLS